MRVSWNSFVKLLSTLRARFFAPAVTAALFALLTVNAAFAQSFDPENPAVDDLIGDMTASATTLFPWWQIAVVTALIIGLAIRFVPRMVKRMG